MNISNLKSKFPVFKKNPNLVFLDTAASALKVDEMIEATNNCYTNEYANIHRGNYELSSKLTKKFEDARKKVADYLNTSENNIIFVGEYILNKSLKPKVSKTYRLNQVNAASVADYLSTLGAKISKVSVLSGSNGGSEVSDSFLNKKEEENLILVMEI